MIEFISSDQLPSRRRGFLSRRKPLGLATRPSARFIFRGFFRRRPRRARILGLLVVVLLLLGIFVVYPVFNLYSQAKVVYSAASGMQSAIADRDLEIIESSLDELEKAVGGVETAYGRLGYLRFIPFLNRYYNDGQHLLAGASYALEGGEVLIEALDPFSELIGFDGCSEVSLTTEERIVNLANILPQVSPQLDEALGKLIQVKAELDQVDAGRYPEEVRGVRVRFWLEESQDLLLGIEPLLTEATSLIEVLPRLLGIPERTYLVLFQNDAELRATGGFITAIGFITAKDGQVTDIDVRNINFATNRIPHEVVDHPIAHHLRTPGILFHDANYFPDFRTSAEKVLWFWQRSDELPPVDSIIGINTGVGARVLAFTGPMIVPEYSRDLAEYSHLPESCRVGGEAFTSENLVCRLEYWVENAGVDKGVVLDKLAEALNVKISTSPAEVWAQIVELGLEMLKERNISFYSNDPAEQQLFETLDFAGRIKDCDGDYLHINDSNLGGKKTNMFMEETVEQSLVKLDNGRWRKTVKIKYYNPQPYDNWLSANYKDWVRVYVPEGSELVEVIGAKESVGSWEESGKTVFDAFFHLWPQKEGTITFVYDLPSSLTETMEESGIYKLLVQKQPGTDITLVKTEIGDKMEMFDLNEDRYVEIELRWY